MAQSSSDIADTIRASELVDGATLDVAIGVASQSTQDDALLRVLVNNGHLTKWHARQLKAGQTKGFVLGPYKLLTPLGAGGTGQVFQAYDSKRDKDVAIKILSRRTSISDAVERFRREARAALQLRHPNIVRTYELCHQGPMYFMVMEYVAGKTLKQHVDTHGRLSVEQTARIGYDIAQALEHARSLEMVHRDIKPSNIMLDEHGTAKLADMGLVKFFGQRTEDTAGITRTGFFMGSVDYCAPEQAEDARFAETASDIYSLGCTLYFCLTGGPPFLEGTDVQKIMAHRHEEPVRIHELNPSVSENFANLIHDNMMSKKPHERFPTPADAANAFRIWIPGESDDDSFAVTLGTLARAEIGQGETQQLPLGDVGAGLPGRRRSFGSVITRAFNAESTVPTWLFVATIIVVFMLGMIFSLVLESISQ